MSMITERPVSNPAGQSPVGAVAEAPASGRRDVRAVVAAYVTLTKPRIVELLLVTTVPAMMLAHGGMPSLWLVAVVLVGGSLAAGAASVINCYIDRDIDQLMRRTKRRPLPAHTVSPRSALVFGLVLAAVSVALMAVATNWLATVLTVAAIAYYDLVYTLWLKRTTAANTFWGGICGAAPVLIGWAAVTGTLAPAAWGLFAVVFFWQMPHFYALAIKYKADYARAGVPMLPVVASVRRVNAEIIGFSWLTVLSSLAVWPLGMSPIYGVTALVVGGIFLVEAHKLCRRATRGEAVKPMRLFHWSTTYLTILFAAVALDALL
ncbi:heme o synthase [Micromonospora aurantiaca]|uniref:Protoheme IX farnesyltransferase n=1 Tax=Micromonospora aurantiaca (nom. illeg.) TaxID=47850 RepID=A0A1C6TMP6_9ACTN|nr:MULTISPECIES: heme o synthase [Micromonospora]ADL47839.1 protoheme IX farnesyltransferase [Micromonospora aurantiaca ATCC 27029]ADU09488.1 protoheme IX farnesyltransferase [Micromonospora sp. L5]AXH93912.1 protoheme IX farnesyltransferase [Micromonospora aurantiaca]KAB1110850.1 protoheme IX farnesyltransferase [Micromonospora aurantiaca]MBC9000959.1 protoheme IX farnesyltransferase [Micromonospora aurantiaca]